MGLLKANGLDCTLLVGVDDVHLEELKIAWRTWREYRPELCIIPRLFVCDGEQGNADAWRDKLQAAGIACLGTKEIYLVYDQGYASQREKMLSGLVFAVGAIETTWFLKLDTDTVATDGGVWLDWSWFDSANRYAFISNPWRYTKPPAMVEACEGWANVHPFATVRAEGPLFKGRDFTGRVFAEPRIISYVFFGNTEWCSWAASMCSNNRLPCPSQDTYLWYLAMRTKQPYHRVRFKNYGWSHGSGPLREAHKAMEAAR